MGSWDCYCAICGSALCGAQVSEKPRTARFQRRRAAWIRRAAAEANRSKSAPEAENGKEAAEQEEEESDASDDNESIESYDENNSYDPAILSDKDVEWTRSCHILGFNPDAINITKAFIAGPGSYGDYGSFDLEEGSRNDPHIPDDDYFTCYYTHNSGELPVFPFHWCCFELLSKALTNTTDPERLDKDLLYNIMHELAPDYTPCLGLDYGNPGPEHEQFWQSSAGAEFLVVHPTVVPQLADVLRNAIVEDTFKKSPPTDPLVNLESRVIKDPFANLPYDILHCIFRFLPFNSLSNLGIASWPVHVTLRNNSGLWKQLLRSSMPWFFELHDLIKDDNLMEDRDFRKLFLWLENATRPRMWMDGPFMALANRRRIWGVCEQLADRYHARLGRRVYDEDSDEMAKLILEHADNPQMPLVVFPPPTANVDTISALWVRSWTDLDSHGALFHVFWDADGSLAGLSLSFSGSLTVFGQDDTVDGTVRSETVGVENPSGIKGLILHLQDIKIGQPGAETSIRGVTIIFASDQLHFGETTAPCNRRPLLVSVGKKLVGVVGQTANGKICRLGILQCARPPRDDFAFLSTPPEPEIPEVQKHLWKDDLSQYFHISHQPIWNNESLRVISTTRRHHMDRLRDIHEDVLPFEPLLWARDANELRKIKCLSGYVVVGGTISSMGDDQNWCTRDYHDVCGARVQFVPEDGRPERFVGIEREFWKTNDGAREEDPKEENQVHFDIDGPGGEVVTRVDVAMGYAKALKLFTNRGRETRWGDGSGEAWQTLQAPEGETIVGLVLAFGEMSYWNRNSKTNKQTHTKMSHVSIMTLPLELNAA